jgi:hypothetical protein
MLLGYSLVLVMGYGNYLGTSHSLPALLIAISLCWLAWLFADVPADGGKHWPIGPTLLFVAAAIIPTILTSATEENLPGEDRVWRDFQEAFGIVWARRIMDRMNQTAKEERWSARLEMPGFVWNENTSPEQRAYTQSRIDHALRWQLRRFVDPAWIDERL